MTQKGLQAGLLYPSNLNPLSPPPLLHLDPPESLSRSFLESLPTIDIAAVLLEGKFLIRHSILQTNLYPGGNGLG